MVVCLRVVEGRAWGRAGHGAGHRARARKDDWAVDTVDKEKGGERETSLSGWQRKKQSAGQKGERRGRESDPEGQESNFSGLPKSSKSQKCFPCIS